MSSSLRARLIGLAILLWAAAADAQRVVVLDIKGDPTGKVRGQIERAIKQSHRVHLVPLRAYKLAAARQKLPGARAMTPLAVAKVSPRLSLSGAVAALVGKFFLQVTILDSDGAEQWRGEFPLKRGALSPQRASQLAAQVTAAVGKKPSRPARSAPPATVANQMPGIELDLTQKSTASSSNPVSSGQSERKGLREGEPEDVSEAHTALQQPQLERRARPSGVSPDFLRAQVTLLTTWRSYCSRPGVSSCSQYQQLAPAQRPPGDTVDYSANVPYVGFALAVEFFPLGKNTDLWRGVGVLAGYDRGFSRTEVQTQTPTGPGPARTVTASDQDFRAAAAYRYFFVRGNSSEPMLGYGGLRVGFSSRSFDVDSNPTAPLPGSHRSYPTVALEGSLPIIKLLKVDASAAYFISPKPSASEIRDYGTSVSSSGFGLELGGSGDVWGPVGYVLRFRYSKYSDSFSGAGNKWLNGGTAGETYVGLYAGASAKF
jgi:hypothetical protein